MGGFQYRVAALAGCRTALIGTAGSMGNSLYIQFNRPFPICEVSLASETT